MTTHEKRFCTSLLNERGLATGATRQVGIYDSTLRDGEQGTGVIFNPEDKVRIARAIDELGVPRIEASFPRVSPRDAEAIRLLVDEGLNAELWGFGRAVAADVELLLELGLPEPMVWRHPFPGPGLAIRVIGEVTPRRLEVLRAADRIAREELTTAGLDRDVWQFPVVLLADVRSVGVQGDGRTYGHPVVLRPVTSEDAMTADWSRLPYEVIARISTRITNEVPEINRVVLDVTSKPPGTIEWE
jgi:hypothetical protein